MGTRIENKTGFINLPGVTSTSSSFRVALQFAKPTQDSSKSKDLQSVLFAICLQNWSGFNGFRMNSALYGAHPEEKEIMLQEGVPMAVLGVEEVQIDNVLSGDDYWADFNMKTVTIVYLFHTR